MKEINIMNSKSSMDERGAWAVGGGLMLGVGVGFFLFHLSVFFFVGSIIAGLGLGLIIAAFVPKSKTSDQ